MLDKYADGPHTPTFGDDKTTLVFTVAPTGKLIDGSAGKTLTFTLGYNSLMCEAKPSTLHDLPVADYKVTGERVTGDGKKTPLKLRISTEAKFADSIDVKMMMYAGGHTAVGPAIFFAAK